MKHLFVVGTRPEAIKLASLVVKCLHYHDVVEVIFTCQHPFAANLLITILTDIYGIDLDRENIFFYPLHVDKNVMYHTAPPTWRFSHILSSFNPLSITDINYVYVQGDTFSALAGAIWAFHNNIPVVHIEAGLRTYEREPFPEENNRQLISHIATFHMAPTHLGVNNLSAECITDNVFRVGNTVIDSLRAVIAKCEYKKLDKLDCFKVLVEIHRTENKPYITNIFNSLSFIAREVKSKVLFTWVVHPSLAGFDLSKEDQFGIVISSAMNYISFIGELVNCDLVITDSGGIQEECCYLGKPNLVLRDLTERPNRYTTILGSAKHSEGGVVKDLKQNLVSYISGKKKAGGDKFEFGRGNSAGKIYKIIKDHFNQPNS